MDLPPELRNRTYELVVTLDVPLLPSNCKHRDRDSAVNPMISRTCRKVRSEVFPIFYEINTFEAHVLDGDSSILFDWIRAVGAQNRKLLRHSQFTVKAQWRCAGGLQGVVRQIAHVENIDSQWILVDQRDAMLTRDDDNDVEPDREDGMYTTLCMLRGAIALGAELRQERTPSEYDIRRQFTRWLRSNGWKCHCSTARGGRSGRCTRTFCDGLRMGCAQDSWSSGYGSDGS